MSLSTGAGASLRVWLRREFPLSELPGSLPVAFLSYFLSLIFAVSFAALIFRGPVAAALSSGIAMTLFTGFATCLVISLTGSLSGAVAIPSDRIAPILAVMSSSLLALLPADTSFLVSMHTLMAALLLTTLLTGVVLGLLGHYRLGGLIRYIPYPVIGGFMAGAGWLLVKGAFTVLLGVELAWGNASLVFQADFLARWLPATVVSILMIYSLRRWSSYLVIPGFVLGSLALFYAIAILTKTTFEDLRSSGWLAGPFPEAIQWVPFSYSQIHLAEWWAVLLSWETMVSVLIVSSVSVLMIASSLELVSGRDMDGDRELKSAGLANLVSFLGGGIVGLHSLSISSLVLKLGRNTRWVGLLTALGMGLTLLAGPSLVNYLPMPILGGLLLFLGLNFLTEWLVDSYHRIPRSDYIIILVILVVIGTAGYITGVGVGLITALGLFVLRYSQVQVVRQALAGHQHRSNVDRSEAERKLLVEKRSRIHVLTLQGFLFFGTAHSLLEVVKQRLDDESTRLRYLVLDFRHVSGIDSSALICFIKLQKLASQKSFYVILSDMSPELAAALRRNPDLKRNKGLHFVQLPDLDHSIEWCENQILSDYLALNQAITPLKKLLAEAFKKKPGLAERIQPSFAIKTLAKGEILAEQNADSGSLYFIESGQISARLKTGKGEIIRLRTMGAGSVVGETGLYLNVPRTASLVADQNCIVHELKWADLQALEEADAEAACGFHEFLARTLADRLMQTNRMLEAAMR